jgi:hypothetical protein
MVYISDCRFGLCHHWKAETKEIAEAPLVTDLFHCKLLAGQAESGD